MVVVLYAGLAASEESELDRARRQLAEAQAELAAAQAQLAAASSLEKEEQLAVDSIPRPHPAEIGGSENTTRPRARAGPGRGHRAG